MPVRAENKVNTAYLPQQPVELDVHVKQITEKKSNTNIAEVRTALLIFVELNNYYALPCSAQPNKPDI